MSPEPDLVASTKSSSSSDKSNSLPRTGQEPDLPAIDIPTQPQISMSDAFPAQHLPHAEPSKKDVVLKSFPEVSTIAPASSVLSDIRSQPGIGIGYNGGCDAEDTSIRATSFKVHGPSPVVQVPHQYPASQVSSVPVAPPRKKRRNRHNTGDVSVTRCLLHHFVWKNFIIIAYILEAEYIFAKVGVPVQKQKKVFNFKFTVYHFVVTGYSKCVFTPLPLTHPLISGHHQYWSFIRFTSSRPWRIPC